MTIMTLEVKSAAKVEGKYGPQWELSVIYPFSKYPTKSWIDREDHEMELMPGSYTCEVERDRLREGKEGAYDYNWNWKILSFNVEGNSEYKPSAPTDAARAEIATETRVERVERLKKENPEPTYEQARMDVEAVKRHSIQRQVALKAAVDMLKDADDVVPSTVTLWAQEFSDWLEEQPSQVPSKPTEPDSGSGPTIQQEADADHPVYADPAGEPQAEAKPLTQNDVTRICKERGWTSPWITKALGGLTMSKWLVENRATLEQLLDRLETYEKETSEKGAPTP